MKTKTKLILSVSIILVLTFLIIKVFFNHPKLDVKVFLPEGNCLGESVCGMNNVTEVNSIIFKNETLSVNKIDLDFLHTYCKKLNEESYSCGYYLVQIKS